MRVISFITEFQVIRRILNHLEKKGRSQRAAGKACARRGARAGSGTSSTSSAFACRRGERSVSQPALHGRARGRVAW